MKFFLIALCAPLCFAPALAADRLSPSAEPVLFEAVMCRNPDDVAAFVSLLDWNGTVPASRADLRPIFCEQRTWVPVTELQYVDSLYGGSRKYDVYSVVTDFGVQELGLETWYVLVQDADAIGL